MSEECRNLIAMIDEAAVAGDARHVTLRIKTGLESLAGSGQLRLPPEMTRPREECYARRLLHRDPRTGYTVVVMTWGPGQRTPLHDHAGMWCVECVVDGALTVEQFELEERRDRLYRFSPQARLRAVVGDAGCLIPPFEYHVLGNALDDRPSVSLHVYAGEMDHCHLYRPTDDGWWRREAKQLCYDD